MLATKTAAPASGEGGHLPLLELRVLRPCHLCSCRPSGRTRGPEAWAAWSLQQLQGGASRQLPGQMAAWLAVSSNVRPPPLRQPPAIPVPQALPATAGTHRPGLLAAGRHLRWPGVAPPGPEGGCNSRKTGDLRTRKTQGPLSLSPPLSDVPPPLATPTQHTPGLSLAASPAATWTPSMPHDLRLGPKEPFVPPARQGRPGHSAHPRTFSPRLAGELCAWAGQVGTSEHSRSGWGTCGHWTDTSTLLSLKRHDYTPCLVPCQVSAARIWWRARGGRVT